MQKDKLSVVVYEKDGVEEPAGVKQQVFNGIENGEPTYLDYFVPSVTSSAYNNLYGRMMTLIEATTDKQKLKSVKALFQRELNDWFDNLEKSARELDSDHKEGHGYYYKNIYVYKSHRHAGRVTGDADSMIDI